MSALRTPARDLTALGGAPGLVLFFVALAWFARALLPAERDVLVYQGYAHALLHGPLRLGLPKEYPGAAGALFVLPRLLPLTYEMAFAVIMGIAFAAVAWAGRPFGRPWLARMVLYSVLAAGTVAFARYDLVPVLAVVLALRAARAERWAMAWVWALAGTLLKIFPVLLLPGFAIVERRRTGRWPLRKAAIGLGGLLAVSGAQELLAPGTVYSSVNFEASRGFEYSSLPGSLTLLTSPFRHSFQYSYGNLQIVGAGHLTVETLTGFLAIGALAAIWVLAYRRELDVSTISLAALTIAVVTNKSLAPQYLLWLAPLWALWPLRPSWLTAAALSSVVYPVTFLAAAEFHWGFPADTASAQPVCRNVFLIGGSVHWFIAVVLRSRRTAKALNTALQTKENPIPCAAN